MSTELCFRFGSRDGRSDVAASPELPCDGIGPMAELKGNDVLAVVEKAN